MSQLGLIAETPGPTKDPWVDLFSLQAQRLLGLPGWSWYSIECVEPSSSPRVDERGSGIFPNPSRAPRGPSC
jgi:hypothetical protein